MKTSVRFVVTLILPHLVIASGLSQTASKHDQALGLRYFKEKQYAKALPLLEAAGNSGNAEAARHVGSGFCLGP